jgi:hypothetical protein
MKLNLNKEEVGVLAETIESSLNRLHDEISHTDAYDYRELLKQRKEILQKLRGKLH